MMEGFRHSLIDKSVVNLISKKILKSEKHAKSFKNRIYINKFGVKILYKEISKMLKKSGKELNREIAYFLNLLSN